MFKLAQEKTPLSPAGLHYMTLKAMGECDYLAEFQCIMLILTFI